MKLKTGQHIHLVGIGGAGLSAIARILLGQGYKVSGSDRNANTLTEALARDGATIHQGHDAVYINGADALIITSAVRPDHVEVAAAREKGIPVYKRQDIIADLMEGQFVIAVAGTHGKTTTTSMIVHVLQECGEDPSYIVGGTMGNTGTNAGVSQGKGRQKRRIFVIEADEYDNMFHGLRPDIIVLTSIEYDHPDFFKTPREMNASFEHFVNLLDTPDSSGILVACMDDAAVGRIAEGRRAKGNFVETYSLDHEEALMRAVNIHTDNEGFTAFEVIFHSEHGIPARIRLPGRHNVQNALAALLVSPPVADAPMFYAGLPALESFKPAGRRFDVRAEVNGIAVIDDYAHHPTAIRVTLEAARQRYPGRAIWAVWQPHTYSRTQALMEDYLNAFGQADHVLITDIYAARENPVPGVSSAAVVEAMKHPDVRHTATFEDTIRLLSEEVKSPAVILIMSAGDAPQIGIEYLKRLQTG